MGQQNGNLARVIAAHTRDFCAAQKIVFIERRLVQMARLLCCAHLDAAMHIRDTKANSQIGFDFGNEQAQH